MSFLFNKFAGDLFCIRYLGGLSQIVKTLAKTFVKEFVLQQSFRLLAESFIRSRLRNSITCDVKFFATIAYVCKIWILILDVAGF